MRQIEATVGYAPGSPHVAVDEHVTSPELADRVESGCGLCVEEACTIGVRQERVVVLGEKPHRRRDLRVSQLAVRDVPKRAPFLILPLPDAPAQPSDDGCDPGEPRPRRDIRRRRWAERTKIAEDEVVEGR